MRLGVRTSAQASSKLSRGPYDQDAYEDGTLPVNDYPFRSTQVPNRWACPVPKLPGGYGTVGDPGAPEDDRDQAQRQFSCQCSQNRGGTIGPGEKERVFD